MNIRWKLRMAAAQREVWTGTQLRRAGPGNARQGGDRPGHCLDYVPGISQPPST